MDQFSISVSKRATKENDIAKLVVVRKLLVKLDSSRSTWYLLGLSW